jgi:putative ABC transport system permease protein
MKCSKPPRLAALLLRIFLAGEAREVITGDLEEEYNNEIVPAYGLKSANRWYWGQVKGSISSRLFKRTRPGKPVPRKGDNVMQNFIQDLRYSFRILLKKPGFTVVAVMALALGIGANSAIFSVVSSVLLRPLPYENPDGLVQIWLTNVSRGFPLMTLSTPDFRQIREQNAAFESMAAYYYGMFNLSEGESPDRIAGVSVSSNLFPLLGVEPALGRSFLPHEEEFGNHRVVVISHNLWRRKFNADQDILGRPITLNGNPYTVIAVMPEDFQFPISSRVVELWVPMSFAPNDNMNTRNNYFALAIGRLNQGVTLEQGRADLQSVATQLEKEQKENAGIGMTAIPLREQIVGEIQPTLYVLFGAVGFVLLIACANVANLQLVRTSARQREIAVRSALGASRRRLIRQLLTESLLLGVIGGAAGLVLAWWGVKLLIALGPQDIPRLSEIGLDARAVLFTMAVSVLTGILFGLAPALQASKLNLNESLKEGGKALAEGASGRRLRGLLVVSEIALALVLLVGAGLMIRSFMRLQQVSPGFNADRVLTMQINLPPLKYQEARQTAAFYKELLERVETLPGVEKAGATSSLPLSGDTWGKMFSIVDRPPASSLQEVPAVQYRLVSPDYFAAMGTPLMKGRAFTDGDTMESQPVAIINETLARRFWPDEDPIGKKVWMGPPENLLPPELRIPGYEVPRRTVVGVVGDMRHQGLNEPTTAEVFAPNLQNNEGPVSLDLAIKTTSDPAGITQAVRQQVWAIDKDLPVSDVKTMEERLGASVAQPRFNALLLGLFAATAMILAVVGIYGVVSYSVAQRRHEIGIRMALGAQKSDVLGMVIKQGLVLALIGVGVGLAGALALTRLMESLLFGVNTTDEVTFALVTALLVGVTLVACYLPARRAARVDPLVALKYE